MPLSEHEQKVLQQMEQALYAEDPRFATHITNHGLHQNKRRMLLGGVGVVAGLALVVPRPSTPSSGSAASASPSWSPAGPTPSPPPGSRSSARSAPTARSVGRPPARSAARARSSRLHAALEDRWDQRRNTTAGELTRRPDADPTILATALRPGCPAATRRAARRPRSRSRRPARCRSTSPRPERGPCPPGPARLAVLPDSPGTPRGRTPGTPHHRDDEEPDDGRGPRRQQRPRTHAGALRRRPGTTY